MAAEGDENSGMESGLMGWIDWVDAGVEQLCKVR